MPKPQQYTRKVKRGNTVSVYSKSFSIDQKGVREANKYERNKSTTKLAGEVLNCRINNQNKTIVVNTIKGFPVKKYKVLGTTSLSRVKGTYSNTGAFYKGFGDVIREITNNIDNLKELTLDFRIEAKTNLRNYKTNKYLTISEKDYNYIHGLFQTEKRLTADNSKNAIFKFINKKIPTFDIVTSAIKPIVSRDFKKLIYNEVLDSLSEKEVHNLLFQLYEKHFDKIQSKIELFKETDTYKLDYIIQEYERHLIEFKGNETKWQEFFEGYFRIINPSYKYVLREVDTIFNSLDIEAAKRPVDFICVDIYNNVELIELKTPNASIISTNKDRNNYYLMHNCTKACTQLEKYLLSIESNKREVEKLIKRKIAEKYGIRQMDINLIITKPKAKIIIGIVKPILKKASRHQDFQMQRHSFKNIELVTFDEILNSLKEINVELKKKRKSI